CQPSVGVGQVPVPELVRTFSTSSRARGARRAPGGAAGLGALARTGIGCERTAQAGGRDAPAGLSPLPVRPLRLRPTTATAGGRPRVTPTPPAPSWPP